MRTKLLLLAPGVVALGACIGEPMSQGSDGSGSGAGNNSGSGSGAGNRSGSGAGNRSGSGSGFDVDLPDMVSGAGGQGAGGGDQEQCGQLIAIVRDFNDQHPDFEKFNEGLQRGLVKPALDADRLPERADVQKSQLASATSFAQWYRDTPDVNQRFEVPLALTQEKPGVFVFDAPANGR